MTALTPPLSRRECCAIDLDADWELEYWAKHFHITRHELIHIAAEVGADSEAVSSFIQQRFGAPRA
jgi:Protein of unknown function (DUF3606)